MTRRKFLLRSACGFAIVALAASFAGRQPALAIGPDQEQAELANALRGVKVSLQQGFTASEREGQPISGKFEVDNGKLQLSVYTAKEGNFFEVIVDHATGSVAKVEPITEGEDLTHAKAQKAAMDRAKVKLADAATKAKGQAKGEKCGSAAASTGNENSARRCARPDRSHGGRSGPASSVRRSAR
jgi:hypothetical protein